MFLKQNNPRKFKVSITAKLTVFYAASTIFLITIICAFSYLALSKIIFHGNQTFLKDEMNVIEKVLASKPHDIEALRTQVEDVPKALEGSVYQFYIRVIDNKNKVILQTSQSKNIFNNISNEPKENKIFWIKSINNNDYVVLQKSAPPQEIISGKSSINPKWIQIALNVSSQHELIKNYRNKEYFKLILVIGFIGAVVAICLGYIVARRGLKDLLILAKTSKKINATSLDYRFDVADWPKELSIVIDAYNQMLARIENGYQKLSQFSADLSHELRTPLHNMLLQNEMILTTLSAPAECKKVFEANLEEIQQLNHIIENILFLARAEQLADALEKSVISVHQEIDEIIAYFQIIAEEKNIKITREGEGRVNANRIMIRRMLNNLLSNAIKYNKLNGVIHIQIQPINDALLQISVKDNGVGIAEEHLKYIGNRFYKTNSKGTGLGLAIVKSIIQMHQGLFQIMSEVDAGTMVIVRLPASS